MKLRLPVLLAICVLTLSQLMCVSDASSAQFKTTITIITFEDANQNGVQDAGEEGVSAVPVEVFENTGGGNTDTFILKTDENGQEIFTGDYTIGGGTTNHCPILSVSITPPAGMVSTSGSNEVEIKDWNCDAGAPAEQNRTVSFGLAPATPTPTPTAAFTATPSATPNPSANAEVIFEKGNTTDLVECSGTEFAFTVKDPEGIKQVYIEFAVAGFDKDFSTIASTLDLTNSGGDTWSGTLTDTFSTQGQVTYWRVIVVDNNDVQTEYYEDGKFSFYAADKSCK